ncbi:Gag protease polyprotein [Cucumis melo var. makuwa]|uniref:Gag protease polyprotein n=1 Tax=Cucumis melo var. makuwa TaxID=1194695 RepID=A0A5A7V5T0_CUCMM|nr:Gag protease polyprotein [Cucumis melo var. makuwa]
MRSTFHYLGRISERIPKMFYPGSFVDTKRKEFLNIRQGDMTVMEYEKRFIGLEKYVIPFILDEEDKFKHFKEEAALRVESMLVKERTSLKGKKPNASLSEGKGRTIKFVSSKDKLDISKRTIKEIRSRKTRNLHKQEQLLILFIRCCKEREALCEEGCDWRKGDAKRSIDVVLRLLAKKLHLTPRVRQLEYQCEKKYLGLRVWRLKEVQLSKEIRLASQGKCLFANDGWLNFGLAAERDKMKSNGYLLQDADGNSRFDMLTNVHPISEQKLICEDTSKSKSQVSRRLDVSGRITCPGDE